MYSMFGYLFADMIMLIIVISLSSCLATYMQLCNQDYEWWWKSFIIGASSSVFVGIYGLFYLLSVFDLKDLSNDIAMFIYFYIFMGLYIVATGYIGVWASYKFVSNLYRDKRGE